jgi:uncharacterized protein
MGSTDVRAVALSSLDVPDGHELMAYSCEDCACPVNQERDERQRSAEPPTGEFVCARDTIELPVDDEYSVLFSPYGNGGVVVVNEAARDIFRSFRQPRPVADLVRAGQDDDRDGAASVVGRLVEQELIHRPGRPPQPTFGVSTELTAWLHVTNACNLRCHYCYVHKSNERMDNTVGRAAVDALVRSAADHRFRSLRLKYAGGEASLNAATLLELHDHAVTRCAAAGLALSAVVLSNGVAIPAALAGELKARGIRMMISLDGIGAANDAQRPTVAGRPSSAMVTRTVETLLGIGLAPHISITITSRNVTAVAEVVRFALERGLTFSFNFFRDNDCAASFADLQYEEHAMVSGLRDAFAVIEELLPPWSVLGSILDRGQLVSPRRRSCGVGDDYVVIDQNGQIAKCHMEIGSTIGDVRTTDPVQAIRADTTGIRNLLVEDKEGCRDCTWRHWCSGGCAVATFRATGRFDVRSPNCNIYKAIYPEAVRLEGMRVLRFATLTRVPNPGSKDQY